MQAIREAVATACKELFDVDVEVALTRPDEHFGDYATNVALQLAKQVGKNPREIAEQIAAQIHQESPDFVANISVAGPGFINLVLTDQAVVQQAVQIPSSSLQGKTVLVEYLDPNPFKELHIGHAYSGTIGDSIAHLFVAAGATVHRVTYQGDVGLHVAKAIYGMQQELENQPVTTVPESDRAQFLGRAYAAGSAAYDNDESAKAAIQQINKSVYTKQDPAVNTLYEAGKSWSLQYFETAYRAFGFTPFEKNYMEGDVAEEGADLVRAHISDGVFVESDGAIIFKGEDHGLHTRVFINAQGLPTYEAKDLGNAMQKWRDYAYDQSVIITAEEQTQYFKVMLMAMQQFAPDQAQATRHIAHGMVRLSSGKMSSRTGKVLRALDVLQSVEQAAAETSPDNAHSVALAALKYAFLKNRIGGDIAFDISESVSLEGNSGPYLQYAHARACSILARVSEPVVALADIEFASETLTTGERSLVRKLGMWAEVVDSAVQELMPHHVCSYLYELAQIFNRFYEQSRVIDDPRQALRLSLISQYSSTLNRGLQLLGIDAPKSM